MCRYESPSHTGRWTHKNREDDSQTHLQDHLARYLVDWQDLRGLPSPSATDTHPDWSPVILPVWIHTPSILGRTCHTNKRLANLSISKLLNRNQMKSPNKRKQVYRVRQKSQWNKVCCLAQQNDPYCVPWYWQSLLLTVHYICPLCLS